MLVIVEITYILLPNIIYKYHIILDTLFTPL